MRRGYKLGEHVLRNALVGVVDTVSSGPAAETGQADTDDNADASAE
jgi:molecular chaperone GrpE